jgi:hypothetical protein
MTAFFGFPQYLHANAKADLCAGHDRTLPNAFLLTIHNILPKPFEVT